MNKIFFMLLISLSSLLAELKNEYLSRDLLNSKIPIVDIRTVGEWKQTGILKGSITLEFFNEQGKVNLPKFLSDLKTKVDTTKPFALVCRTGSRTLEVSKYLSKTYNYKVTNIAGGLFQAGSPSRMKYHKDDVVYYK